MHGGQSRWIVCVLLATACDSVVEGTAQSDSVGESSSTGLESSSATTAGVTTSDPSDDGESTGSSSTGGVTGDPGATTTGTTGTADDGATGSSGPTGTGGEGGTVCEFQQESVCGEPSAFEGEGACDPFGQDCPAGEKCLPYAAAPAESWNSTRCSPVANNPRQLGQPCVTFGGAKDGQDNCDVGLMCWDVDAESKLGTCIELCGCGPAQPTCQGSDTACSVLVA